MSLQRAKDFGYRFNTVCKGYGAHYCHFCSENRKGEIPNTVWVFQELLSDIVEAVTLPLPPL